MNIKRAIILGLGVVVTVWTCFMLMMMGRYVLQSEDQFTANIEAARWRVVVPMVAVSVIVVVGAYVSALAALGWLWTKTTQPAQSQSESSCPPGQADQSVGRSSAQLPPQ